MLIKKISSEDCINLIGGIIKQAIEDLVDSDKTIQTDALNFLYSESLDHYCYSIGVNANYVRNKIGLVDPSVVILSQKQCKRMPWGSLKKMDDNELKEYRKAYRRERAKQLAIQQNIHN